MLKMPLNPNHPSILWLVTLETNSPHIYLRLVGYWGRIGSAAN